jgi:hypothetical protein
MRTVKDIFNLPALILHEISHVLVSLIFGGKLNSVKVNRQNNGQFSVILNILGLNSRFSVMCVAMSPLLIPITFTLLSFINQEFLFYFVYAGLNYKTTLPSPMDFRIADMECPTLLKLN